MKLPNTTITTLTKFTHLARRELGIVKVADILKNPKYASNLFIQATLSENDELISLAKILDRDLRLDENLIIAIENYISALKNNKKSSFLIHRSKYYLLKLSDYIYGVEINGMSYRHAVDELLANIDIDDKTFCINLSRSFYPFWKKAYSKLIELQSYNSNKHKEFAQLWNTADELFLSDSENWHINYYKNLIQRAGANESEVEARVKMAKLILNELRNHDKTSEGFRAAVEIIGANILTDRFREYFQVVSREFYSFWMDSESQQEV